MFLKHFNVSHTLCLRSKVHAEWTVTASQCEIMLSRPLRSLSHSTGVSVTVCFLDSLFPHQVTKRRKKHADLTIMPPIFYRTFSAVGGDQKIHKLQYKSIAGTSHNITKTYKETM